MEIYPAISGMSKLKYILHIEQKLCFNNNRRYDVFPNMCKTYVGRLTEVN